MSEAIDTMFDSPLRSSRHHKLIIWPNHITTLFPLDQRVPSRFGNSSCMEFLGSFNVLFYKTQNSIDTKGDVASRTESQKLSNFEF